jgi:hypothetical protein
VISSSDLYGVSPADVYKTYLGTNKIIIDDEEGMIFDADKLKIYQDTVWQTTVKFQYNMLYLWLWIMKFLKKLAMSDAK